MKGESDEKRGKKTQQRAPMLHAPEAPPILGERPFERQLPAAPSGPAATTLPGATAGAGSLTAPPGGN